MLLTPVSFAATHVAVHGLAVHRASGIESVIVHARSGYRNGTETTLAGIVQKCGNLVRDLLMPAPESPLKCMSMFVKDMNDKGIAGLASDYRRIDDDDTVSGTHTAFSMNMPKNRYSDVYCIDDTRVSLKIGATSSDYIHANYVTFPELKNTFICTQGPLQTTRDDFWKMVFQERAATILMLCRSAEEGKPKCAVYWPENGEKLELNTVTVEQVGEEQTEFETIVYKVQLKDAFKTSDVNSEPLVVKHYRWSTWPDRGIPSHESAMVPLKLLSYVRETGAPCIVHCSAGIGRTGTVIAIEMGIQRFRESKKVDLAALVKELRKKRAQCIQTEVQYLYVARVLVEYVLSTETALPEDARSAAENFLREYDTQRKK